MPGGSHRVTIQRPVRGDDPLPTKSAVDTAKREAWDRVCRHAYHAGWPLNDSGREVLELAPAVALMALAKACPEVAAERLARCLGLSAEVSSSSVHATWMNEAAGLVADVIRRGA